MFLKFNRKIHSWYQDKVLNITEPVQGRWIKASKRAQNRIEIPKESRGIHVDDIVTILRNEAGENISVVDTRLKCDHMDFMVIGEGRSSTQIYSMVDAVKRYGKHRLSKSDLLAPTLSVQGYASLDWMVVDFGKIMVHAFTPQARKHYDLESLWSDEEKDQQEAV